MAPVPTRGPLQLSAQVRWRLLVLAFATSLMAPSVHAQSAELWQPASPASSARVLLVRADETPRDAFVSRVERALNRILSDLGLAVSHSSLPFHDAQLAAGCAGSVRDCGGQVALALESEQLVVTTIDENPRGRYPTLTLQRFAPHTTVRAGTAQLPRETTAELDLTVYALAESVFADRAEKRPLTSALPAPAVQPAQHSQPEHVATAALARTPAETRSEADADARGGARKRTALLAIGWPTVALGAGLLVGGLVSSLSSRRESRAYTAHSPDSPQEVDEKLAHSRNAQEEAETARLLWGLGGGFAAAGVFLLLWERFAAPADRKLQKSSSASARGASSVRIFASPSPHGFSLSWRSEL